MSSTSCINTANIYEVQVREFEHQEYAISFSRHQEHIACNIKLTTIITKCLVYIKQSFKFKVSIQMRFSNLP